MDKNVIKAKTKDFWQKYEHKIILIIGFVLVAIISFEGGMLKGQKTTQNPLIIEKPVETVVSGETGNNNQSQAVQGASVGSDLATEASKNQSGSNIPPQNCAFIGSKNSNKYHLPTCRYAKNINPENRVCFSSQDDAKSKGYLPDKNCIK